MAAATSAGTGAGQNLAGVGMNVNLAPVLDVYYKSGNFIDQFQRSYSNNPAVVSQCGQAFITAQQATGVAATAKHFPGLGSATKRQNTDTGPVTLTVSLTKLHTIDEVPYPTAVSAGVKLIMVSWAIYPALDANLPAGLSPTIIGQELRGRNNFTGVTITDALEAGALNGVRLHRPESRHRGRRGHGPHLVLRPGPHPGRGGHLRAGHRARQRPARPHRLQRRRQPHHRTARRAVLTGKPAAKAPSFNVT